MRACNLGRESWTFPTEAQLLAASHPGIARVPDAVVLPPDTAPILSGPATDTGPPANAERIRR
jgi:hypothetical protein